MGFKRATKFEAKLRLALIGPAGSGKTFTALSVASGLGGRIALLDSEHGSAAKYADIFEFDSLMPESFSPQVYIDAIRLAEREGYGVVILDSLSHAWAGKGGALEMVDAASRRAKGNKFVAWGEVTPLQQEMVDAILGANLHVISTMRSKMEYSQELDADGKKVIRKLGMQPVQRDLIEYEFDVIGDLDNENAMTVTKSRIPALSGQVIRKPGKALADELLGWLSGVKREPAPVGIPTNGSAMPTITGAKSLLKALQAAGGQWPDEFAVAQSLKHLGIAAWPKVGETAAWAELYAKLMPPKVEAVSGK